MAVSPLITSVGYNLQTFMLTVPTEIGPTYVVEYKDSLNDSTWAVLNHPRRHRLAHSHNR